LRPVQSIGEIAVSPDGKRLAWIERGEIRVGPLANPLANLAQSQRVTAAASPGNSCTESDLAWSPDSAALAFLSDCADLGNQSDLYLSHLNGNPPVRLSSLHGDVNAPAFSPDRKRIAFLYVEGATRPAGALAAMDAPSGVIGEDGIEVQRVASVAAVVPVADPQPAAPVFLTPANLHVYEFDWSPDSTTLAYVAADPPGENNWWVAKLYTQSAAAGAGSPSTSAEGSPSTNAEGPPSTNAEGALFTNAEGPHSTNTEGALSTNAEGAPSTNAEASPSTNTEVAPSFSSPAPKAGGREGWETKPTVILDPNTVSGPLHGLQIALPHWSPDGKAIAFIGGLMSDQGVTGGDVWVIDAKGDAKGNAASKQPLNLTPNRPASSEWIAWGDDEHIFTLELADGVNRLVRISLQGDRTSAASSFAGPIFSYPGTVGTSNFDNSIAVTADRSLFVFQASSFDQPPEIYAAGPTAAKLSTPTAGAPGPSHLGTGDASDASPSPFGLTQLSHLNDNIVPIWGDSASLTWTSDKLHIQGWLLLPAHYDSRKKYPLIVEVHGGPAADIASRWNGGGGGFSATGYSVLDYFVLMPNPRGSFGEGEAFTQANRKDFGYGDLRDILAGVDTVLAKYPVDPNRVGITGWSYGGFMTMFAVTQTHRFKAAVAGAGISDWLSYYGENSIDQWMIPYFGASVYDDPEVYAKSSAITYIKNVTTPTLTVVGDRDGECPAPQSFEFWHALRDLHVAAQLVVYPNEGHGFSDPAHRYDVQQRAVDWFAKYMPPAP
jgi:dipeptidyl aminopeptidase/acylaminoacyl peptidase